MLGKSKESVAPPTMGAEVWMRYTITMEDEATRGYALMLSK